MVVMGPIMQPGFPGRYPLLAVELGARRRELAARVELPRNNRSATKRACRRRGPTFNMSIRLFAGKKWRCAKRLLSLWDDRRAYRFLGRPPP